MRTLSLACMLMCNVFLLKKRYKATLNTRGRRKLWYRDRDVHRRLSPEDVWESGRLWRDGRETGTSPVCDDYKISQGKIVSVFDSDLLVNIENHWSFYRPLEEAPDLILKFSRLHMEHDFEAAALVFSRRYGLPDGPQDRDPAYHYVAVGIDELEVSRFYDESRKARLTLALYEAVLNGDAHVVRRLIYDPHHENLTGGWRWLLDTGPDDNQFALAVGLRACVDTTQEVVGRFCRQVIIAAPNQDSKIDFSCVRMKWEFDNLLGAMYLQLWWLLASGGGIARCDYCGRMITLARPHPDGRKPPKHKRFCDAACRQANHRSKRKS